MARDQYLNLHRPIYKKTAACGHFGRSAPEFTWEWTDRVQDLRDDAGRSSPGHACPGWTYPSAPSSTPRATAAERAPGARPRAL